MLKPNKSETGPPTMASRTIRIGTTLASLIVAIYAGPAAAQFESLEPPPRKSSVESRENIVLELGAGVYKPDVNGQIEQAFDDIFDGDRGPAIHLEIDGLIYRIPYLGHLGVGVGINWARYKGRALDNSGNRTSERSRFDLVPISTVGLVRIDVLARELNVPLVLTGKLGADFIPWFSKTGAESVESGTSIGLRWALQLALELDFIDPSSVRRLDTEWGINHTYFYFEIFGSTASTNLPLGDRLAFTGGLALVI